LKFDFIDKIWGKVKGEQVSEIAGVNIRAEGSRRLNLNISQTFDKGRFINEVVKLYKLWGRVVQKVVEKIIGNSIKYITLYHTWFAWRVYVDIPNGKPNGEGLVSLRRGVHKLQLKTQSLT